MLVGFRQGISFSKLYLSITNCNLLLAIL